MSIFSEIYPEPVNNYEFFIPQHAFNGVVEDDRYKSMDKTLMEDVKAKAKALDTKTKA